MTTKKHGSQRIPLLLLSLALFIGVAAIAINRLQTRQKSQSANNQVPLSFAPSPSYLPADAYFTPVVAPPVASEEKWQVYANTTLGISLKHPPDWFFNEDLGPFGAFAIFSTPINNPSSQNWRLGELAGGTILSKKLGNNETLESYIEELKIQQPSVWANYKQSGTLTVGNKKGLVLEGPDYDSITVFVENNGVAYEFDFGATYQSAKSNYEMYRQTFERVLSTVIFSN